MEMEAHLDLAGPPISELQIDKDGHVHWLDKGARDSGESDGTTRETMGNEPLARQDHELSPTNSSPNRGPEPLGLNLSPLAMRLVAGGCRCVCVHARNVTDAWAGDPDRQRETATGVHPRNPHHHARGRLKRTGGDYRKVDPGASRWQPSDR